MLDEGFSDFGLFDKRYGVDNFCDIIKFTINKLVLYIFRVCIILRIF